MSNVVIVTDMQKCFLEEGGSLYLGAEARGIIPYVQQLLTEEAQKGSAILFSADAHDPDDLEFKMFPPHCIVNTPETEIIPELGPWVTPDNIIKKRRYSAFFESDLGRRLETLKPEVIKVCGVCTNICVLHTVADLRNRDYRVIVDERCVATFDPEGHEFALEHMQKVLGAEVQYRETKPKRSPAVKTKSR